MKEPTKNGLLAKFFRLLSEETKDPGKNAAEIDEVKKKLNELGVTGSDEEILDSAKAILR